MSQETSQLAWVWKTDSRTRRRAGKALVGPPRHPEVGRGRARWLASCLRGFLQVLSSFLIKHLCSSPLSPVMATAEKHKLGTGLRPRGTGLRPRGIGLESLLSILPLSRNALSGPSAQESQHRALIGYRPLPPSGTHKIRPRGPMLGDTIVS